MRKTKNVFQAALLLAFVSPIPAQVAAPQRQAEIATRGADVMPFSLEATTHVFTKTAEGGTQRVITKSSTDGKQVKLVRAHLRGSSWKFSKGDFSGPSYIHGNEMPGLAALKAGKPGQVAIAYKDVVGGAELTFRTAGPTLVAALHQWFDAQTAALMPSWLSLMTSLTPRNPLRFRLLRNSVQKGSASECPTFRPST